MKSILKHRSLVWELTKRDVVGRYRGSFLGLAWSFFNPLIMLAVYTFVFGFVFRSKWDGLPKGSSYTVSFALVLFLGLLIFQIASEVINRAPGLIAGNVNYVKRVVFPLDMLPVIALGSALFHAAVSFVVWLIGYVVFIGLPPATAFFLPLVLLPFIIGTLGAAWFLSSIGVFVRDISQITAIATMAMMFLAPIFFPASHLPPSFRFLALLNPVAIPIEQARLVLIKASQPDWTVLAVYSLVAVGFAVLGYIWFQKTRHAFADVL